jgi:hypothetical protein
MTLSDTDMGFGLPLMCGGSTPLPVVEEVAVPPTGQPWQATDETVLLHLLEQPMVGLLGCRTCAYLLRWDQTCGGRTMMSIGIWTYSKDQVDSPRRLRKENRLQEHYFDAEQRTAVRELLQEELVLGIVTRIALADTCYISPSFTARKSPGKDGKIKWRKVWDGQRVSAGQVIAHFRMESPVTV